jgi:uncharacterized protein with ParB-like and HNH nuclease domain
MSNQIDSDKLFVREVFDWWFRVPDYQRPYVWGVDQVNDLLDDVSQWQILRPDSEYFFGSIVLQRRNDNGYVEYDLLDGQQRLTTCLMAHAVARDMSDNELLKASCRRTIFQQGNPFDNIPERFRIVYDIRDEVQDFANKFIKTDGGTNDEAGLKEALSSNDLSVRNMASALLEIRRFFTSEGSPDLELFFQFFRNKVLMVYVASPNLDDAFRMFTVLNDRGMKLRGSDILKTLNLRALSQKNADDKERRKWARYWEDLEGELGDDFDVFLSQLRALLVKDKARLSLLQEFEDNIYAPRVYDKQRKEYQNRPPLLQPGLDTFRFVERYHKHYQQLLQGNNYHLDNSWRFDNLIVLLDQTSQADFWLPPLLRYRDIFGDKRIVDFLRRLENKFCGDWVTSQTPTDRITAMNKITAEIDAVSENSNLNVEQRILTLLASSVFDYDRDRFRAILEREGIYSRRFARYLLFKLDVVYASPDTRLQTPSQMSVEHVLPQTPESNSQWCRDFTLEERATWTDRLGNLVLLSRRKNSSQGRLDFPNKKAKYFKNNVEIFPRSVRVMQVDRWDLDTLRAHHREAIDKLVG